MTCFYLRKSVFIQLCEWRHKNPWNQGLAISCDLQWLVCLLVHTSLGGCVARCWQCQGCKDFYEARPTKAQCVIPLVLRGNKLCIDSLCVFRCHIYQTVKPNGAGINIHRPACRDHMDYGYRKYPKKEFNKLK